jgi:hypothetical protein
MELERSVAMAYKWFTSRFPKRRQQIVNAADSSRHEPLDHPELSHMTQRELADLPMPSYTMENCTGSIRIV